MQFAVLLFTLKIICKGFVLFKVNSSSFAFQTHLPIVQRPTSLERHASEQTFSKLLKSVGPKIWVFWGFGMFWDFGVFWCLGVLGCLGILGVFWAFRVFRGLGCFGVFGSYG